MAIKTVQNQTARGHRADTPVCHMLTLFLALALYLQALAALRVLFAFRRAACDRRVTLCRLFPGDRPAPRSRYLRAHGCCKLNKAPPSLA
jgi:hypothetical protein